ncbi:MAG: hypothetical protein CMJ46_11945 [Planctomyces sp.]|nr:hypothetical protein [Planctomyces sp.]
MDDNDDRSLSGQPTVPPESKRIDRNAGSFDVECPSAVGDIVAGRYELLDRAGQGGMGAVWKAVDRRLGNRIVAIKRMLPEIAADSQLLARFHREASVLASLQDPHIVQVFDIGEDAHGPFLVMQWIDGVSLEQQLREDPLSLSQVFDIFLPIARSLHRAHQQSIFHRDVKPSNIMKDGQGKPYLIDFGLARIETTGESVSGSDLTSTNHLGSIEFMSPEQVFDPRSVTAQSDLWSLAATIYFSLTRRTVRSLRESLIPEPIREILLRALEHEPEDRHADLEQFAEDLKIFMMDHCETEKWTELRMLAEVPFNPDVRLDSNTKSVPKLGVCEETHVVPDSQEIEESRPVLKKWYNDPNKLAWVIMTLWLFLGWMYFRSMTTP